MAATRTLDPDVERRALALFERLSEHPGHARFRERLLRRESAAVRGRVEALEARSGFSSSALPTTFPDWMAGPIAEPPAAVGPFRLVERVGSGGMGDVWRAERADGLYEQKVAIKLIHPRLLARAGAAFDEERRFLARLEHPNIARLIDGGVAEGIPWLATEFVAGQPIDAAARGRPLRERIGLFVKAADAAQYVHSQRIAHGDIKPANILVAGDARVKLVDFGIGSAIGAEAATPGAMTRAFASPERLAGEGPSIADDVFALGRTLALVVTGEADPDIAAIVARATDPDPATRYGSAAALIADLDRWREQLPVSARAPTTRYVAGRFVARHRTGVLLASMAALALLTATIVSTINYVRAERERAEATARFADARGTARYLLFDLMDRLEQLPHSLTLRADVARVAQHYLDRLAHAQDADDDVRLEAATGLWRLAQHQSRPGRPNLRQPEAARANLESAARIARSIGGDRAIALLAAVYLDEVLVAITLDGNAEAATASLRRAQAIEAVAVRQNPALRYDYAYAIASLASWQGNYPAALAAANAGLALPPASDAKATLLYRAALTDLAAESYYYLKRLAEAETLYRRAMALSEAAHKRWPGDNYLLSRLARARWSLGSTLTTEQRFREASVVLAQGAAEAQRVLAFDPDDQEAVRGLRIVNNAYAQALAYAGDADASLAILRLQVARDRAGWSAHPRDPSRLRDYAMSVTMFGEALGAVGRKAESCATDGEAADLFRRLKAIGSLTNLDIGSNIVELERRRARNCG